MEVTGSTLRQNLLSSTGFEGVKSEAYSLFDDDDDDGGAFDRDCRPTSGPRLSEENERASAVLMLNDALKNEVNGSKWTQYFLRLFVLYSLGFGRLATTGSTPRAARGRSGPSRGSKWASTFEINKWT